MIDPDTAVPADRFDRTDGKPRATVYGRWQRRFIELSQRVMAGDLEPDVMYLLGRFENRTGAYNLVHRFVRHPETLPIEVEGVLNLEWKYIRYADENGEVKYASEVWGSIGLEE